MEHSDRQTVGQIVASNNADTVGLGHSNELISAVIAYLL